LELADDQAHYKDQLQVHAPRILIQLLLQGQEPTLYLEEHHLHT
jgi:hypothetical protein